MSGSIPKEFIKEIIDLTDISEIIQNYLPLRKKGKDLWGLCPFCEDGKNPSFSVSPQKQFYYCFKCRSTGNVIGFLQDFEGLSFVESVEDLSGKLGLEIPYQNLGKKIENFDSILEVLKVSSDFFESKLSEENAKKVQNYLKEERAISGEICRKFSVGYAPKSWDALTSFLKKKGFSDKLLVEAGLSKLNKEKNLYDVFRDRLIFPIKNKRGHVLGFGGRVMNPEDNPKYLNTGETKVFQKGKELYGLHEALEYRKDLKKIFVVEGYIDVIAMSEKDMRNSVATLGVASNRFHIQTLLQIVNEIIFCFDGDDAGRGAAWGALKNSLPVIRDGNEIRFLFLPEGEDPASILKKEDKETFERRIQGSKLLSEYFIERLTQTAGSVSLENKASLASKAMDLLKSMQESSLKKLLEIEVSKITGIRKEDISSLSKVTATKRSKTSFHDKRHLQQESIFDQDSLVSKAIGTLISYPQLCEEIESVDWIRNLQHPEAYLFIQIIDFFRSNPKTQVADLLSSLDKESVSFIGSLIANFHIPDKENSLAYFKDCLDALKKTNPLERIKELKFILEERKLTADEVFELQKHLLSNLDNLGEENRSLLKVLSQSDSETNIN